MGNSKLSDNALQIASARYFMEGETWQDCAQRVGFEAAVVENGHAMQYADQFAEIIYDMDFMPGGRILRNSRRASGSLFNCYVLPIGDSIEEIGSYLKDSLILWSEGGGVGCNLSYLRPRGAHIKRKGGHSSGPVSFLEAANASAGTIECGGQRRAAALACINATHPDVMEFIDAKLVHGKLSQFNISVAVTEEFLEAVEADREWQFKFAQQDYGTIRARVIWDKIIENMVSCAEPGLLNWDKLRSNNSYYFDPILSTNPCGEVPLAAYGVCDLGSLVLPNFITGNVNTNWKKLERVIRIAVRFLDNIIDTNKYVLREIDIRAHNGRRVGIGLMGLAEYLFAKKLRYGSEKAVAEVERLVKFIRDASYQASVELAAEKGAFPKFDPIEYGKAHFVRTLPASLRMDIKSKGIRNVTLMAMAPTGCQKKDTMVVTDQGLLKLEEIGNIKGEKWQDINLNVSQEYYGKGEHACKFYVNGEQNTKKIHLKSGNVLEATYNHQYRVLENGKYLWKRSDEIVVGDDIVSVLDTYSKNTNPALITVSKEHHNENEINTISTMTEELSEFLGIYFGDGSNHKKGIRISCNSMEEENYIYVAELGRSIFGVEPTFYDNGRNCMAVCFNSNLILKFFKANGLLKQKSPFISVPKAVRVSSRTCVEAFIKGVLFADGSKTGNTEYLDTSSEAFAREFFVIVRSLGKDARIREHVSGLGTKMFRVYIKNGIYKFRPKNDQLKKQQLNYLNLEKCVVDEVVSVEDSKCRTFDIEVPKTMTYIANSVVSHNTISLIPEVSSGIEPLFLKAYKRHDQLGDRIYVNPVYKNLLEKGEEKVEWMVDTSDLKPEDHLETQVAVQKYTDGAVSKTINMPKGTTPEELSRLTLEYIYDLKGVTAYVDGSREDQVLNSISEEEVKAFLEEGKNSQSADVEAVSCANGKCEI
jgi:ribonucleotide reductase alpha subunit